VKVAVIRCRQGAITGLQRKPIIDMRSALRYHDNIT
jgi:hypothetical protein